MVTKAEKIFFAAVILFLLALPFFWRDIRSFFTSREQTNIAAMQFANEKMVPDMEKREKEKEEQATGGAVAIVKRWDLPAELTEVSGIAYLDPKRFLCIQDEEGSLFVFNTETGKIDRTIPFAGKGDFEGLTLAGSTAYVLRSDGVIYEVKEYNGSQPKVTQYETPLTAKNECEGIAWDQQQNRLLITVKSSEIKDGAPLYSFDLATKKIDKDPALTIDFNHPVFEKNEKKKDRTLRPSAINIHPATGEFYVLEGTHPKLLIMDKNATPRKLVMLDKSDFAQPEGLTFSPGGELFISNEGGKGNGNILHVVAK